MVTGEVITEEDLICLRPENGIKASEFSRLLGKELLTDIKALSVLSFDLIRN